MRISNGSGLGNAGLLGGLALALLLGALAGCSTRAKAPANAAEGDPQAEQLAATKRALDDSMEEITRLRAEVDRLRHRETELSEALKRRLRADLGSKAHSQKMDSADLRVLRTSDSSLRRELKQQEEQRQALQTQIEQLKARAESCTAPAPAAPAPAAESDAAPAAAEAAGAAASASLRAELDAVKAERAQLAARVEDLQRRAEAARKARFQASTGGSAELRRQVAELEQQRDELRQSLQQARREPAGAAAASDAPALPVAPVASAPVAPDEKEMTGAASDSGSDTEVRQENTRLRSELEEERKVNARLAAKLKVADRVAELIFRMNQQGVQTAPPAR